LSTLISQAAKPKERPIIATICGDAGLGKTSLAASFPKALFILAEDGLQAVPSANRPDALPALKDADEVFEQLKAVAQEEHTYRTLVIDSVTALDQLFQKKILANDPKAKSMNQANGGYGAGYGTLAALHGRVREWVEVINRDRLMNVLFLAHVTTETMRLPDADDYSRYALRLHEKSMAHYVDNVDLVGFLRLKTNVMAGEAEGSRAKAVSFGERELICYATAANVSKNRYGINGPVLIPHGENPFLTSDDLRHVPIAGRAKRKAEPQPDQPETAGE
jgi:hypothetical protein